SPCALNPAAAGTPGHIPYVVVSRRSRAVGVGKRRVTEWSRVLMAWIPPGVPIPDAITNSDCGTATRSSGEGRSQMNCASPMGLHGPCAREPAAVSAKSTTARLTTSDRLPSVTSPTMIALEKGYAMRLKSGLASAAVVLCAVVGFAQSADVE